MGWLACFAALMIASANWTVLELAGRLPSVQMM